MGRKLGLFFMMILLVGCTDNTRPASNLKQSENVALQKMADAHNATVKDPDQKVVCHRVAEIGSRFTHLECRTVWQTKQNQKDAKDFVNMPRDYPTDGH